MVVLVVAIGAALVVMVSARVYYGKGKGRMGGMGVGSRKAVFSR